MWLKVWTIGNGGISYEHGYFDVNDCYDSEDYEDDLVDVVEGLIGPLSNGVRSINWDKVDILPKEIVEQKIKEAENSIEYEKRSIEQLRAML